MIKIAVVEDERKAADYLIDCIRQYEKSMDSKTLFEVTWFQSSEGFLEQYQSDYDIIFFDIQMPLMSGMEAARRVYAADKEVLIIFVTNLAQYAINGYEVNALDYMLKPVAYNSIADKLDKALARLAKRSRHTISITKENAVIRLNLSDIFYVEVLGHTLVYHTVQGEYSVRGSLSILEQELCQYGFARCNKGYLVNMQYVRRIEKNIAVVGDETLMVSRGRQKQFMSEFLAYIQKGGVLR